MKLENLYTYAFLEEPDLLLQLPQGYQGQVLLINTQSLAAIVEPGVPAETFNNDDQKLIDMAICHDRVICEVFLQITVLPLRFGTCFASEKMLVNHLESQGKEYKEKLSKIQGKEEITLKITPITIPESAPIKGKGKDYFLAKKQQYQNQQEFNTNQWQEKQKLLEIIQAENHWDIVIQEQEQSTKIHFLINTENRSDILEQFLYWQESCPRWDLTLGESLPPYHFI